MTILTSLALIGSILSPQSAAAKSAATLSAAEKTEVITNLCSEIENSYVEIERSKRMSKALKDWAKSSEFGDANDPAEFSAKVNQILKGQVTDAHLRFRYSADKLPVRERRNEPSAEELKRYAEAIKYQNANFEKVERLAGNVGYIKFNGFASPEDMMTPLTGALNFLSNVSAFIIDLRTNGGGDPAGVRLFCSAFFTATPVHLNDIALRDGDKLEIQEFWTLKEVPFPRFPTQPVYVLTSKRTGSGAEECAYDLQTQKRAPIIGEPTWGGANPGGSVRLSDHFSCFIPVGKAINPITKTNWEGTGVKPDIAMAPADSLKPTHLMAIQALIDKETDPLMKEDLQATYNMVKNGN